MDRHLRRVGLSGNIVLLTGLFFGAFYVYWFATGGAQAELAPYFAGVGHFHSWLLLGMATIPLWLPECLLRMGLEEDNSSQKTSRNFLGAFLGIGIGAWLFLWVFVYLFGPNWWVGRILLSIALSYWYFFSTMPGLAVEEPIDDAKLKRAIAIVADRTGFEFTRVKILKLSTLPKVAVYPPAACLVINRKAIEPLDAEELAAVILHEYGHVNQVFLYRFGLYLRAGFSVLSLVILNRLFTQLLEAELTRETIYMYAIFALAADRSLFRLLELPLLYLSRFSERRADQMAIENKYSTELASALRKYLKATPARLQSSANSFEIFSTHPNIGKRIKYLEQFD